MNVASDGSWKGFKSLEPTGGSLILIFPQIPETGGSLILAFFFQIPGSDGSLILIFFGFPQIPRTASKSKFSICLTYLTKM
jgi:hypothetical protein